MAAAAALNVVKQIEALADGPETPQMKDCLGQLVTSLQFFLDHPDSRVRLCSARTLLKLSKGYGDTFRKVDLVKAESALARCRAISVEDATEENAELGRLLAETLEGRKDSARPSADPAEVRSRGPTVEDVTTKRLKDGRGEVVLKVSDEADPKTKAAILEKVVNIIGVVSVTFEGTHIIVATRTPEIAADSTFVEDLQRAMSAQGLEGISAMTSGGASQSSNQPVPGADPGDEEPGFLDDEDGEPAYLDDDDDDPPDRRGGTPVNSASAAPGQTGNWSFFAQTNWMTGRRMQEFDDDPTIAARLAKAKQKMEEKKKEEESRIGFLSRWMGKRT